MPREKNGNPSGWTLTQPGTLVGVDLKMFAGHELGYQYRAVTLADADGNRDGVRTRARHCLKNGKTRLNWMKNKPPTIGSVMALKANLEAPLSTTAKGSSINKVRPVADIAAGRVGWILGTVN